MSRVQLSEAILATNANLTVSVPASGSVTVYERGGTALATIYSAVSGGTALPNPRPVTNGYATGYIDTGSYDLVASANGQTGDRVEWEALRGDSVETTTQLDTRGHALKFHGVPNIGFDGDSLSVGSTFGTQWGSPLDGKILVAGRTPGEMTMHGVDSRATYRVVGLGGQTLVQRNTAAAADLDPYVIESRQNIVVLRCGTNDLMSVNGATAFGRLVTYLEARQAAGWTHAVVHTITPRSGTDDVPGDFETRRGDFNTLLRAEFDTDDADHWLPTTGWIDGMTVALADVGGDDVMGNAADEKDVRYYTGDRTHHTQSGYVRTVELYTRPALAQLGVRLGSLAPQRTGLSTAQQRWNTLGVFDHRTDRIWIPPTALAAITATAPTRAQVTPTANLDAWSFNATDVASLGAEVKLPEHWDQFSADLYCLNIAAGTIFTGSTVDGSDVMTGLSATTMQAGDVIGPGTGNTSGAIKPGTTVVSVNAGASTLVMSNPARADTTTVNYRWNRGNVVWQAGYHHWRELDNAYAGMATAAAVTTTIGGYQIIQPVIGVLAYIAVDANAVATKVTILRNGASGGDTATDVVYLLGIRLRQDP